ncbi:MAG: HAD hydrolase-like protein [Candidatus Pacebacteria bacterium]|nr:HAD hydrolase-like protein [Candidatus Paceibacterota bacterium]
MPPEFATPLPPPRAVLFDWDNSLVDSWSAIFAALNHCLTEMGQEPWSDAEARLRVRASLRDAFPKLFGERWQMAREIYLNAFKERHLVEVKPFAQAEEFLQLLQNRGITAAVVSNKTGVLLRAESAHLGWDGYFYRLIGAQDTPADKPHPGVVTAALAGSGIAADPSVWFIGDAAIDMDCAVQAGCTPILIGVPHPDEDFSAAEPQLQVTGYGELIGLLGK